MKLIDTKPENFNANYIYFNEPIQNTIINESRFIRILYSTPNIIFNGINILLKINIDCIDKQYNKNIIYYNIDKNTETINNIKNIEEQIFEINKELNYPQINKTDLLKVLLVTISWGMNYPIMKFVLNSYPPSIFRAFTFFLGFVSLGLIAIVTKTSLRVPANEQFTVFRLSMFNMVGWHVPMIYGVSMLNSGRAAIIGYTMPVWAMLSCVIFYKEKGEYCAKYYDWNNTEIKECVSS